MKRVTRTKKLTPQEAAKYRTIRRRVQRELPELIQRHQERLESQDQLAKLCDQLKIARKRKGLSLADLRELTGMDRSAISKLESGQRPNPTLDTLVRYAEAVGKHVTIQLADAQR